MEYDFRWSFPLWPLEGVCSRPGVLGSASLSESGGVGGLGERGARLSSAGSSCGSCSSSSESGSIQLRSRAISHGGEFFGDGIQLDDVRDVAAVMMDCSRLWNLVEAAAGPREMSVPDIDPGSVESSS
jgi:hypothetical protein